MNGVEQGKYTPLSGNTTINLTAATEVTGDDVLLTGYELATGSTEEQLAIVATDTVNEAFGKIQKQNYDNEAVIAGALNDLDERITVIEISGSSGGDVEELSGAVKSKEYVIAAAFNDVNTRLLETKTKVKTTRPAGGFEPNVFYKLGTIQGSTTFTLAEPTDNTILNHYYWTFETASSVPTITWPSTIVKWYGGGVPVLTTNAHYEVSIIDGYAMLMEILL